MDCNEIKLRRSVVHLPNDRYVVNLTLKNGESWLLVDSVIIDKPELIHSHSRVFEYKLNIKNIIIQE